MPWCCHGAIIKTSNKYANYKINIIYISRSLNLYTNKGSLKPANCFLHKSVSLKNSYKILC